MKAERTKKTVILDNDDVQIMFEAIIEAVQTIFKSIEEWQEEISSTITNFLKVLCTAIEDVKIVIGCPSATTESQDPSATSRMYQTVPAALVPSITVEVSKVVVDLGTPEFNDVLKDKVHIIIDFSSKHINEVYVV